TPYQFLLEKFKSMGVEAPENFANILDFILNAPVNLKTTKMIEPIMNWVMNDLEDSRVLKSLAVINFATLVTRACLNPCGREYLGNSGCQMDNCKKLVEDTYLPWLAEGLNNEGNQVWERMVYMMALYNFNSEKILTIIRPYAIGTAAGPDTRLRLTAIYALRKNDMPYSTKNEILQG
ncbi:unnamed protein product, partial [Meganyctiphanes norvegica]